MGSGRAKAVSPQTVHVISLFMIVCELKLMLRNKYTILVESLRLRKVAFMAHVVLHVARHGKRAVRGNLALVPASRLTVAGLSATLIVILIKLKEVPLWLMSHSKVRRSN